MVTDYEDRKFLTPSEIGERAEAAVLAALAAAGREVLIPFGQHRFDFAYEDAGRLVKVQCKTGIYRRGVISFRTHSVSRSGQLRDYRNDDIDFFCVYCHERREVYMVPVADVPFRRGSLRVEPTRNRQKNRIRHAARYLLSIQGHLVGMAHPPGAVLHRRSSILTDIDTWPTLPGMEATIEAPTTQLPVLCCAPLAAETITDDEADATAALFKALSDPHRVKILNLLATSGEAVCVCDINDAVGLSQPTVSFHLKKLASAGLLTREQRGTWAYYSIDPTAMNTLSNVVQLKEGAR